MVATHADADNIVLLRCSIVRSGDAIYVRVGDHDLTSKEGSPGAQTLRVSTTYIHHNHNTQTLDNDIALLKMHGEVSPAAPVAAWPLATGRVTGGYRSS